MKKTEHYLGSIFIVLSALFFCGELIADTAGVVPKFRTAPSDYRFQALLDVQPENDRFIVRILNASKEKQTFDMKTVHYCHIPLNASRKSEGTEKQKGVIERSTVIQHTPAGDYAQYFDSIDTETVGGEEQCDYYGLENNPVTLMPQCYAGIYIHSAKIAIFEPLKSAVYEAKSGDFWSLGCSLIAELPGPNGKPVADPVIISPSYAPSYKPVRITRDMIYKFLTARQTIDLQEKNKKPEAVPKDVDRFQECLSLIPDKDALMADVVCVNPDPGKDEPRTWPPHSRQIHMKTLATTSWQWHVKAGYNTLYESQQTGSPDTADYSTKSGNCPKLGKGQLVGRIVRFSESPMFPAVEGFFAKNKSKTAECGVRLKLKLYLLDEDGNPREAGDLFSDWVVVTRQDYQQILKSAVEHARKEKLQE